MNFLNTARDWLLKGTVFALPLFFLPLTGEYFEFNKLALLVVATLVGLLLWALAQTRSEFVLRTTPFDLPVLVVAGVFLLATLLVSPNKYDDLLVPGTTSIILAGTLFYFLLVQHQARASLASLFLAGGAISALISVLVGIGGPWFLANYLTLPAWLTQASFATTGGLLPSITLFAVLTVFALALVLETRRASLSPSAVLMLIIVVAGLVASVYQGLPGAPGAIALLPLTTGWAIALETLKRNILLGVGPGNFIEAFNRFRSIDYNSSSVWTLRFAVSSNWYLHVWTVAGLLGIGSFLWMVWTIVKRLRARVSTPVAWGLVATMVVFLLAPANLVLIFAFYLFLALFAVPQAQELTLQFAARGEYAGRRTNLLPGFIAMVLIALGIAVGYFGGRAYAAEMSYRKALNALAVNDGRGAYLALVEAINLNPRADRYRTTFSQTDLAIANSIASKKELTDQEKQTVAQLVQQSVREAQAAVALHRNNAATWENLARIYTSLIPFAKDAEGFATQSYQQAASLDPVNPLLRVAFGGVYYSLKQYDNAIRVFELAVAAKPDFANAHYNLAVALREKGDTARALQEMRAALSLLPVGSNDYNKAKTEVDELQKKVDAEVPPAGEPQGSGTQPALTEPQPAPSPAIEPKLDLPESAAPPPTESAEPSPAL